jgi:hypothetical protein
MSEQRYRLVLDNGPFEYWTGDPHRLPAHTTLHKCESGTLVPLTAVRRYVPVDDEPAQHERAGFAPPS